MPIFVDYTVQPQDLGRVLPSATLGAALDLATITVKQNGLGRAVEHTCAAAWEYSHDSTNWYAVAAGERFVVPIASLAAPVYYARSTAGGRLDFLVVK
jgi:hypothetical protein